uniref:Uncharacterized protein n=1 Tax=Lactuca sativa TaxID=4236 RepID=A0A9R1UGD6_LACSA|nr:hypothetical protein LSAT_V11C900502530 [Lactuca sativa]
MAGSHLNSIILILVSVSLASFSGNLIAEAQIPKLPVVPKRELPAFPKPDLPMLPKPELPVVPKPEIHHGASGPLVHQCKTLNLIIKLDRFTESDKYSTPRLCQKNQETYINVIGKHGGENSIYLSNSPSSKISGRPWSVGMAGMINLFVYTFANNIDKKLKTDQVACLNRISPSNMTTFSLPFYCP